MANSAPRPRLPARLHPGPPLRTYRCTVATAQRLTPHLIRVTLTSGELDEFVGDGPDQRVKLIVPRADQDGLAVTPETTPRDVMAMPAADRPVMRSYTIRAHRPGEVDVDFALHEPPGPATSWALEARPGDAAAFFGPVGSYAPPDDARSQLVVADSAALPAAAAILEELDADAAATALLAVASREDALDLVHPEGVTVHWVWPGRPGPDRLVDALDALGPPEAPDYAWIAGEVSEVNAIRERVAGRYGLADPAVCSTGYWRRGEVGA